MKRVIIESPFRPGVPKERPEYRQILRRHVQYARLAMLDSLRRGEAPFISHLLYTQVWSEDPEFREAGIRAGSEYLRVSETLAIYQALGVTDGMRVRIDLAEMNGIPIEYRSLGVSAEALDAMPFTAFAELA